MMKTKFNKFERVAGLFVGFAILGFFSSMVGVAIRQGWFESKVAFTTTFQNADGIHPGSTVRIAGIKAGSVDEVELLSDNRIQARFSVLAKFHDRIREDSVATLIRPFVIGERVLDIAVGTDAFSRLPADTEMRSSESMDLMSLMSGANLGQYLETMSGMMGNLRELAVAFSDKDRTHALIGMFDRIEPLVRNLNSMSIEVIKMAKQANQDENFKVLLTEVSKTTRELNRVLPDIMQDAPQMATDVRELVANLSELTKEFKVVIPALAAVAPELPKSSRRAVEALDEAVVLIKAMQKSFFVRSSAQEVREEEAQREQKIRENESKTNRLPSNE